jgi:hypothetical protein
LVLYSRCSIAEASAMSSAELETNIAIFGSLLGGDLNYYVKHRKWPTDEKRRPHLG